VTTVDYERLFQAAPAPRLILAPDLTIVAVNRAYLAATVQQPEALLGKSLFDAFPDNPADPSADGVQNLRGSLERVLATGKPDSMALQRYDIPVGEGQPFEERYWSPVNTPVLDEHGRVSHIIHQVEDVTEFVRLRHAGREQQQAAAELRVRADRMEVDLFVRGTELQDANQQLRQLNEELSSAHVALREQQRAKDRFIVTLSHELRNPLAAVRAAVDVLTLDVPHGHAALAVLQRQIDTLTRMTDDLLDASRTLSDRLELMPESLDLGTVVAASVADVRNLYAGTGRTLRMSLPAKSVMLNGDRVRLTQVMGNLLDNAYKYTQAGGTVIVELARAGGEAVLTVGDDGIGFPPAAAEALFEVFARAAPTNSVGLGIGLSIVRSIVELHGGTVHARSEGAGTGAEFTVRIPLARQRRSAEARRAPGMPLRILIVEDNIDLAMTYQTLLELRGHDVTVAHTGRDGVRIAGERRFDVIVCDIGLPDIDGFEVARRLRADKTGGSARLVALSGFRQEPDRERAVDAGFDEHLAKPMAIDDWDEFLRR
jgi:signal transduction histidine kinase